MTSRKNEKDYKGWTIQRPDHNSAWWSAERPSGRTTSGGQSIPEAINATTKRHLLRAIDRKADAVSPPGVNRG